MLASCSKEELEQIASTSFSEFWTLFFFQLRHSFQVEIAKLHEANTRLLELAQAQKQQIDFLEKEANTLKEAREFQAACQAKRKHIKKQPVRDAISNKEFETVMALIQGESFQASRTCIAFILLYCSGLRISNLLVLKVRHLYELLEHKTTCIPLIKRGHARHEMHIGVQGQRLLQQYRTDINRLLQATTLEDVFFAADPNARASDYAIKGRHAVERAHFDKQCNLVLV